MNPYASPAEVRLWALMGREPGGDYVTFTMRSTAREANGKAIEARGLMPVVIWRVEGA